MPFQEHEIFIILESLSSERNDVRLAAEVQYEAVKNDTQLPVHLINIISRYNSTSLTENIKHVRKLSVILLRQVLIAEDSLYMKLEDDQDKSYLRSQLLMCALNERDFHVRQNLCEIIGEMCLNIIDSEEWPELLPFVYECTQSVDASYREIGLSLYGSIAPQFAEILLQPSHIAPILWTLSLSLVDVSNEFRVMHAAIRAFSVLLGLNSRPSDQDALLPLLEPSIRGLQLCCQQQNENIALRYIDTLIEMVEQSSNFFVTSLLFIFESFMELAEGKQNVLQGSVVQQLLEFLVILSERIPKYCRKLRGGRTDDKSYFSSRLLPFCAELMTRISDDQEWNTSDTLENYDVQSDFCVGEQAFDRITHALGVRATFTTVLVILKRMFGSQDHAWECRHAGLYILANYVDVSSHIPNPSQLQQHCTDICATMIAYTGDSNPRVRAGAFFGFSKLLSGFSEDMFQEQIDRIIQTTLTSISSSLNPVPRVRTAALLSLCVLLRNVSAPRIERWSSILLGQVIMSLEEGPIIVQEQCVHVIQALADTAVNNSLSSYYDSLMPVLQRVLSYSRDNGLEQLWGNTLECCAMVGEASGMIKFRNDAMSLMNMLISMQTDTEAGSITNRFVMKTLVRVARSMGTDFLPYLGPILQKVLDTIQQNVCDAEGLYGDANRQEIEARSDIEVIEGKNGWFAIRTEAIEEQACACQLIIMLVERMQEDYFPFVNQTINALVPLCESPHEDIRCYAARAMPHLVRAVAKRTNSASSSGLSDLTSFVVMALVSMVQSEDVFENILIGLKALQQVIHFASANWLHMAPLTSDKSHSDDVVQMLNPAYYISFLSNNTLKALSECMLIVLRDSIQRRAVLRAEAVVSGGADEDDQDDDRNLSYDNSQIYSHINDLISMILRTHSTMFALVYLDDWAEMIDGMLHEHCLPEDQTFAASLTYDFINFGFWQASESFERIYTHQEGLAKYIMSSIPRVLHGCVASSSSPVRQKCSEAIQRAVELYPKEFAIHASIVLNALARHLSKRAYSQDDRATDACVCTFGVILEQFPSTNTREAWDQWLSFLPLHKDIEKGKFVLRQILRLLKSGRLSLISDTTRAVNTLKVLLEVLGTELLDDNTSNDIKSYILQEYGDGLTISSESLLYTSFKNTDLKSKFHLFEMVAAQNETPIFSSSPGMTAPIHTVLLGKSCN